MAIRALLLLLTSGCLVWGQRATEKPVLEVVPSLAELGPGWTTNSILVLLDPLSRVPGTLSRKEVDSRSLTNRPARKPAAPATGWIRMVYGRGDLLLNKGAYFVSIQRWSKTNALEQAWSGWATRPDYTPWRGPPIGERCYWTEDERFHGLTFRRGLFHVVVTCGAQSDHSGVFRLAEAIDAKIAGRRIPLEPAPAEKLLPPGVTRPRSAAE